jgi:formylglycine-generating enzyme required for sulfatase activity
MTELEYEKACRGPADKVANDFAWDINIVSAIDYAIENDGTSTEYINNPGVSTGNANYSLTLGLYLGPLRVGIFAASAINKNREETGASYYGIIEMSGNLYERVVSVGNATGRNFTGLHGNGIISSTTGNSTVSNWPNGTTGEGFSHRGASWYNSSDFLRVSDRFDGASLIAGGNSRLGFRCARTAEL